MYPSRDKYLEAVKSQVDHHVFTHSLAVEACMGGLYDFLKTQGQLSDTEPVKEDWLLAGLIHDIDYGGEFKDSHPTKNKETLQKYGLDIPDTVHRIVMSHAPELTGVLPKNKAEWSIFCMDSLTGLITAVALIYPSKRLEEVKVSSVLKRFLKEPRFAAGTRREEVKKCENPEGLNIPIERFIEICLEAMRSVAGNIGL